ncbi:MAG TPA: hypothetical protein VF164_09170 [Trueperaceae bacterium]
MTVPTATIKRKRRPKPGDTQALRRTLWAAIRKVEEVMDDPDTEPHMVLRCVSALATVGGVYLKAEEQAEIITRLEELEAAVKGRQ